MPPRKSSIAVVGGGIAGSCAASELSMHFENVIVFDQGQRGPGGRASHRSVNRNNGAVLPDDNIEDHPRPDTFQFDHGCQFFRSDSKEMSDILLPHWISKGWAAAWNARLGCINGQSDFFGVPSSDDKVYIGVGGMHLLPRRILEHSKATVFRGTRVSSVRRRGDRWVLYGTSGKAAYHDTTEAEARKQTDTLLAEVDAVIFTDISSSSESWHRASAGIPHSLRMQVPQKSRLPLFSCMVALSNPVAHLIPFDGFSVDGETDLWFAASSQSKPGIPRSGHECWTLISTPSFAVNQIKKETMRDPISGEFRPQEDNYLKSIPGPALFDSFLSAIKPHIDEELLPSAVYLQAQRWGSGLPVPDRLVREAEEILDTHYCSKLKSSLVFAADEDTEYYIADDELRFYYAGDFCSSCNPGFEAAALSGTKLARHVIGSDLK